jgi:hypothetical protein
VSQAKQENGVLGIELSVKNLPEPIEVLKGFIGDRQADQCIDQVGVDRDIAEYPGQQSDAVADCEQGYENCNVFRTMKKKDHAQQVQQMIVAGNHMLGTEIGEDQQGLAGVTLQKFRVAADYPMRQQAAGE